MVCCPWKKVYPYHLGQSWRNFSRGVLSYHFSFRIGMVGLINISFFPYQGLGLQVVNNVDDAEFILAHGTEALGSPSGDPLPKSLEELEQVLMLGLERRLPMVVANPDYVTVEARDLRVMPGMMMT